MRFDANLSILFADRPLLARPAAAVAAGFDAVELWWPFGDPVPIAREADDLVEAFGEAGVQLVLLNLFTGDPAAGQHGLLSVAAERPRFRDNVDAAVDLVRRLGGSIVNSHFGNVGPGADRASLEVTAVENLAFAAERVAAAGATLVLEALNPTDFPRYGLNRTAAAVDLVRRAATLTPAPVRILFDLYHAQRAEGDLIAKIQAFAPEIAHVQIADVPDRGRPGTGEIAFDRVFAALDAADYAGYIGLEYRPSVDPDDTFSWLPWEARGSGAAGGVAEPRGD